MGVKKKSKASSSIHHLHLVSLLKDTAEVLRATEALFASLSPEQLIWKPERKAWSILECFDHLLTTNNAYLPRIREAIGKATATGVENLVPYKPSWFASKFIDSMRPGSSFKVKTFGVFKPKSKPNDLGVTQKFIAQQQELLGLIKRADRCDLNGVKLSSPANRLIRFSIGEALTLLVVHQQRHLLQAQNVQLLGHFPEFQS